MHEIITTADRAATAQDQRLVDLVWSYCVDRMHEIGAPPPLRLFDSPQHVGPAGEDEYFFDDEADS